MYSELGRWYATHDGDPRLLALYLEHYSYQTKKNRVVRGHPTFAGPGEKMCLLTSTCDAGFIWRRQTIARKDGQQGVECSFFRNIGGYLSSSLILEAMGLAWKRWPGQRLFTFVNAAAVRSANPGYCYLMAGWSRAGRSKKRGLLVFEVLPV